MVRPEIVPLALGELVQRGRRSLPRLPAFHAAQTPGEIVDKGRRHMPQLAQVDTAGRPTAGALGISSQA